MLLAACYVKKSNANSPFWTKHIILTTAELILKLLVPYVSMLFYPHACIENLKAVFTANDIR